MSYPASNFAFNAFGGIQTPITPRGCASGALQRRCNGSLPAVHRGFSGIAGGGDA